MRQVASTLGLTDAETQDALAALNTQLSTPTPAPTVLPTDDTEVVEEENDGFWVFFVTGGIILAVVGLIVVIFTKAGKPGMADEVEGK